MRKPANITIVPKNVVFQRATSKMFIMNKLVKNLLAHRLKMSQIQFRV